MNASRLSTVLLGGVSLVMLAACNEDENQVALAGPAAQVTAKVPREVCTEETVTTQKPVKDEKQIAGTVAGAVVGGAIGNELGGKGTSRDIATVGGAVAGGYAGNRIQKNIQENATETTTKVVCRTVYE